MPQYFDLPNILMYLSDMNSKLLRGSLETIVIKLLSDHAEMYGYEITQHVKDITKGELQLTEGALYPTLHKLEAKGVLSVETKSIGNRFRKYYSLTKAGKKELKLQMSDMESYISNMILLLQPKLDR